MDSRILTEQNQPVINRQDAKSLGLKRFFTGEPCKYGHVSERNVHDNRCRECMKIAAKTTRYRDGRPKCIIDECSGPSHVKGLCEGHYNMLIRKGYTERDRRKVGTAIKWIEDHKDYSSNECLIWPFSRNRFGYGIVYWGGRTRLVHVIICSLTKGPKPKDRPYACHSCGKGTSGCVNQSHLRWDTAKKNAQDKIEHGTHLVGEKIGNSKLSESEILEIRALAGSLTHREIGEKFGVSRSNVGYILNGLSWNHVSQAGKNE